MRRKITIASSLAGVVIIVLVCKAVVHNKVMNQRSDLFSALNKGDYKSVESLLDDGVVLNYKNKAELPLIFCIRNKDYRSLELLLKHGAETNNLATSDALVLAVSQNDVPSIELLLRYGADPFRENHFSVTPHVESQKSSDRQVRAIFGL